MLKGHVFKEQIFRHEIYALFSNTILNGMNGILDYRNKMALTYSGSDVTIASGVATIKGRLVEEDTSTTLSAGTEDMYCVLVIEIDLDKQNTESECNQLTYKILKNASGYPNLTTNDIVNNNEGVYQFKLADFRTSANGISEFYDRRTFLNFDKVHSNFMLRGNFYRVRGGVDALGRAFLPYPTGFNRLNTIIVDVCPVYEYTRQYYKMNKINVVELEAESIMIECSNDIAEGSEEQFIEVTLMRLGN